ncbi:hypothetical protein [Citrobacter koseri]|uniref:hypothetical protein n=1 Tax=Citrobacter koseri TaxID=545 RepID=UPI0029C1B376|nr:hypothetical protein [Citrobacter koseri]
MKILKLLAMVILITSLSIVVNIALIKLSPDVEYSLWVSAQSLILTFMAATYCVKTKINKTLGMGIDLLGVLGVAMGVSASITSFYANGIFKIPDALVYSIVIVLGLIFIIWDYMKFKNESIRILPDMKSTSTFRETNNEIVITTRINKGC